MTDQSETASATYSFPASLGFANCTKRAWDFSTTGTTTTVSATNIALTGSPIFLTPSLQIPVELIYFSGEAQKGQNVLKWKTATERNTAFFDIEKSLDGRTFAGIGKIKAAGNTNTPQYYSFSDDNSSQTVNTVYYYRLRIVDTDGSERFSNIVALSVVSKITFTVFPNPFDKILTISVQSLESETVSILLTDVSGRVVYQNNLILDKSGVVDIPVDNLSNGLFFIKIKGKNETIVDKLVKN